MDIEMTRGDTQFILLTLLNPENKKLLLEDTDKLEFTVKKTRNDKKPLIYKSNLDGGVVLYKNNKYKLTINPEDTRNLNYGTYRFDIQLTSKNNIITTLILGELTLTDEISF